MNLILFSFMQFWNDIKYTILAREHLYNSIFEMKRKPCIAVCIISISNFMHIGKSNILSKHLINSLKRNLVLRISYVIFL